MNTPKRFAAAISGMVLPSVFNPYRDCCPLHDRPDAARIRKRNLTLCLESAIDAKVDTIWIARDLGYRGGRRTGVPLTDEVHLAAAGTLFGGVALNRATRGPVVAERTAAVVWNLLRMIDEPAVLWNIFPLHPHEQDDPFSNRCHTRTEREATWPLLEALFAMIQPRRIIAIGKDAGAALSDISVPVNLVRHPSYGGQSEFITGICDLYGVSSVTQGEAALPLLNGHYAGSSSAAA